MSSTIAAISGHHNAYHIVDRERPASLIDGNTDTKWVDLNFTENGGESYLIVEMQDGQHEPAAFELFTNLQVAQTRNPELATGRKLPLCWLPVQVNLVGRDSLKVIIDLVCFPPTP